MPTSPKTQISGLARAAGAPLRNYFNAHFENTKDEVRAYAATSTEIGRQTDINTQVLTQLGNVVAETEMHQSRIIGQLRSDVAALTTQVDEMQRDIAQMTALVAALVASPDTA